MPGSSPSSLAIAIVSDVVCPWCYVGKRRLEAALDELAVREPGLRATVTWHPFQLNPDLAPEGMDRRAYVDAKFGSAERAARIYDRVRAAGATVGIPFAFERIARQPNTLAAHRLISWAEEQGGADALVERLFRAYFVEGRHVGDPEVLATLAGEADLDHEAARAFLASGRGTDAVAAMDRRARELGIDGVPFFIFGQRIGVSGAQEPETLLAAIRESRSGGVATAGAQRQD